MEQGGDNEQLKKNTVFIFVFQDRPKAVCSRLSKLYETVDEDYKNIDGSATLGNHLPFSATIWNRAMARGN